MTKNLMFLPLGGAGEIGMNLNLYGWGQSLDHAEWMMIDLGITFASPAEPGADVFMPDPSFIEDRKHQLKGLVLTHAHEDHLGAVAHLWPGLECPIYATPFTRTLLIGKLKEAGLEKRAEIIEIPLGGRFKVGPFDLELVTVTHSIPEPNAIAIRTPKGLIVHTGDWKFDPDPVIGEPADETALKALGDEGVLALVCDSTNVFTPGHTGSEAALFENIKDIIGQYKKRVAVACFASNVARLETIAKAAAANGRKVVLAGRSLKKFDSAARKHGYLKGIAPFLDEEDTANYPARDVLIICTGSQGEPRAALSRIASGDQRHVKLGKGDAVLFSSREIPGNETSISRLQNNLAKNGVEIITGKNNFIHVSGHPARDELSHMYQLTRPKIAIPVHGEFRHIREHANLAKSCQVPHTVEVTNGDVIKISEDGVKIIDQVYAGRLAVEGNRLVPSDGILFQSRTRVLWNGSIVISVVINANGQLLAEPEITSSGLLDDDDQDLLDDIHEIIPDVLKNISKIHQKSDKEINEALRVTIRRYFRKTLNKKPITTIHLMRLDRD